MNSGLDQLQRRRTTMNFPRIRLGDAIILLLTLLVTSCHSAHATAPAKHSPDEVLVVYNSNSPISTAIAQDYQARRAVKNAVAVQCIDGAIATANESIPFADYKTAIEAPVLAYLAAHPGINFIVTTKGVPLRIVGGATGSRDYRKYTFLTDLWSTPPLRSSVDGHLAALGYGDRPGEKTLSIIGSGAQGFAWINRYANADEPFSHAKFGGYLVTRLDGYTQKDAERLVTRALEAERGITGSGILLDAELDFGAGDKNAAPETFSTDHPILTESAYKTYNAAMERAHDLLDQRGIPNEFELGRKFIGDKSNLAGYFSWGSNDSHFTDAAYQSLTFAPGSIGDTAVSTSARTFLPTTGGQSLIADLITHGLTCVKGDTDEPLLQAMSAPSVLLDRYTSGYTMAESFSMASPFTGWEDVYIGDPLCCPYPNGYVKKIPVTVILNK